jgi:hypothetical protein
MLEFLQANAPLVSAVASVGTLTIWAIYLHIFVSGYQRQIKPMLIINRVEGSGLDARCFVTNMSRDPVHIQSVVAKVLTQRDEHTAYITDAEDVRQAGNPSGWEHLTRQGPLQPGTMVDMGAYHCILDYVATTCCEGGGFFQSSLGQDAIGLEMTVVGIYGSEDLLIGATRVFEMDRKGEKITLRPRDAHTRQITGKKERRNLAERLAEQL